MVVNTPDPPKSEPPVSDAVDLPAVLATTDSDEDGDVDHAGYDLLPQDANDGDSSEGDEFEETAVIEATPVLTVPPTFDKGTAEDIRAVWNTPPPENNREAMNQETADQIVRAMKGFSLPSTAIPAWASEVGEEEWKKHLLDKIRSEK